MLTRITHIALPVLDQDEALQWFTEKLEFEKRADSLFPNSSERWLTISPKNQPELEVVLQPPQWGLDGTPESRQQWVGQTPGWVVVTDDCQGDYEKLQARGVEFVSPPEEMPWGVSAVFKDLYGNRHNLLQPYSPSHNHG
jgi:predicted enzyme related to lactoylglutathione lyase